MTDFEGGAPIAEQIKFNLEKLHRELEVDPHYGDVVKVLLAAGERLKAKVGKIEDVSSDREGVTEEDIRIEQELGALIDGFQDGSIFYSEEERTQVPAADAKDVWISDPISNTKSLKAGRDGYAITVARRLEGATDFSAVYDPGRGKMYTAYRGKGAYMNGQPIRIPDSAQNPPRVAIGTANKRLVEAFGEDLTKTKRFKKTNKMNPQSVALNTLEIIEGTRDGSVILAKDFFPHPASQLVVQEAGGKFTNMRGDDYLDYTDEVFVVGANAATHAEILEFVQGLAREKGIV